jgi:hypothetical protein
MRFSTTVVSFMMVVAGGVLARAGSGDSPVGDWSADWRLADHDRGVAFLTFSNDFSCAGYGYSEKSFGIFPITGSWTVDPKNRVLASMVFDISTGGRALSTKVNVVNGQKLVAKGTNPGGRGATIKGKSPSDIPNLSGNWSAKVNQTGDKYLEEYVITVSTNLVGVFELSGIGNGPAGTYTITGELMASPYRLLAGSLISNYGTSMTITSSVIGKVTGNLKKINLRGETDEGKRITIKADSL